jgi:hypothetical protein
VTNVRACHSNLWAVTGTTTVSYTVFCKILWQFGFSSRQQLFKAHLRAQAFATPSMDLASIYSIPSPSLVALAYDMIAALEDDGLCASFNATRNENLPAVDCLRGSSSHDGDDDDTTRIAMPETTH